VEFLARGLPPRTGLRRDLWISTADASAYSVMVGCGEHYIPAFALALGFGPVATGLTASAPLFVGAVLQLVTPLAVRRMGTNRGWVVATTAVQAISFLPLIWWALRGHAEPWELLIAVSIYWSAGMAGAPAWNAWIGTLIPERMRTPYFAHRSRLGQFAVLAGFVAGGLLLEWGKRRGVLLPTAQAGGDPLQGGVAAQTQHRRVGQQVGELVGVLGAQHVVVGAAEEAGAVGERDEVGEVHVDAALVCGLALLHGREQAGVVQALE
jgi:hypothetical protein